MLSGCGGASLASGACGWLLSEAELTDCDEASATPKEEEEDAPAAAVAAPSMATGMPCR